MAKQICICIVIAAELRYGAVRRESQQLSAQVEAVIDELALEAPAERVYGQIRATERIGRLIGANDLLIAAQAVALSLSSPTTSGSSAG